MPPAVQTYYDKRNELIKSQGLVFRGKQLVLPLSLRKDMPTQLHSSHIGIGGCVRCAHEILYWPRMSAEIRDFVSRCVKHTVQHRLARSFNHINFLCAFG